MSTLVKVMFEFTTFLGTPLKQQWYLILELFDYLNIVYLVYKYI